MKRLFVIRERKHLQSLQAFLHANCGAMARDGRPMAVRCSEYREPRSNPQNDLMWRRLRQIEEQAWADGRQFEANTWHEWMKRQHLPEETRAGVKKWLDLPDGTQALAMSTTDLDTQEFSDYIERLTAYAATELGVDFSEEIQNGKR